MEAKISNLSINPPPLSLPKGGKAKDPVADSWEDDEESATESDPSSEQMSMSTTATALSPAQSATDYPSAPPPTPVSPTAGFPSWESSNLSVAGPRYPPSGANTESQTGFGGSERRRPEKSAATAGRLIAAGLGVKAPKQTEEQKKYEQAAKDNELKRRKREKEEMERRRVDDERAKKEVWDS